jgi:K+-transporting ATPase c subunit
MSRSLRRRPHNLTQPLLVGILAAGCGLAGVIIMKPSLLPFGSALVGASTKEIRHFDPNAASPSSEQSANAPSGRNAVSPSPAQSSNIPSERIADTQRGDRFQTHDTVRETGADAIAEVLKTSSASTLTPSLSKHATAGQRPRVTAEELRTATKLAPTPETRPTTIKGWMLREVTNGTAVLEGPNGIWRVTTGQTVRGVGRVDSIVRWGNRWIVSTSKGLISTP